MTAVALYLSLCAVASLPCIESFRNHHNNNKILAFRPGEAHRTFIPLTTAASRQSASRQFVRNSRLFGKKYAPKEKESQEELFFDLESKFDYEGRISSKVTETISGDEDEETPKSSPSMTHRCALVTILGMPNMGKSTLLNALLSDNLAITTSRPQTTRHAILGVMTTDYTQLCMTDTPGIIGDPAYRLQEGMMESVTGAVNAADVFLVVTDVYSGVDKVDDGEGGEIMEIDETMGIGEDMLEKLNKYEKPVIVCVNKVDLVAEKDGGSVYDNTPMQAVECIQKWRSIVPNAFCILPTCAANGPDDPGVVALRSMLLANDPDVDVGAAIRGLGRPVPGMFATTNSSGGKLITDEEARNIIPLGPPLYHPDFFTDRTDRFCTSELIRESIFTILKKELPYCCEVRIETFDESKRDLDQKSLIKIEATILVERDSQKGIVVGKGGTKIKDVGMDARKKLQEFFGCKIFLDLRVKVDKNWRNNEDQLKKFGYIKKD